MSQGKYYVMTPEPGFSREILMLKNLSGESGWTPVLFSRGACRDSRSDETAPEVPPEAANRIIFLTEPRLSGTMPAGERQWRAIHALQEMGDRLERGVQDLCLDRKHTVFALRLLDDPADAFRMNRRYAYPAARKAFVERFARLLDGYTTLVFREIMTPRGPLFSKGTKARFLEALRTFSPPEDRAEPVPELQPETQEALAYALEYGDSYRIALVGKPGSGKSTLLRQTADRMERKGWKTIRITLGDFRRGASPAKELAYRFFRPMEALLGLPAKELNMDENASPDAMEQCREYMDQLARDAGGRGLKILMVVDELYSAVNDCTSMMDNLLTGSILHHLTVFPTANPAVRVLFSHTRPEEIHGATGTMVYTRTLTMQDKRLLAEDECRRLGLRRPEGDIEKLSQEEGLDTPLMIRMAVRGWYEETLAACYTGNRWKSGNAAGRWRINALLVNLYGMMGGTPGNLDLSVFDLTRYGISSADLDRQYSPNDRERLFMMMSYLDAGFREYAKGLYGLPKEWFRDLYSMTDRAKAFFGNAAAGSLQARQYGLVSPYMPVIGEMMIRAGAVRGFYELAAGYSINWSVTIPTAYALTSMAIRSGAAAVGKMIREAPDDKLYLMYYILDFIYEADFRMNRRSMDSLYHEILLDQEKRMTGVAGEEDTLKKCRNSIDWVRERISRNQGENRQDYLPVFSLKGIRKELDAIITYADGLPESNQNQIRKKIAQWIRAYGLLSPELAEEAEADDFIRYIRVHAGIGCALCKSDQPEDKEAGIAWLRHAGLYLRGYETLQDKFGPMVQADMLRVRARMTEAEMKAAAQEQPGAGTEQEEQAERAVSLYEQAYSAHLACGDNYDAWTRAYDDVRLCANLLEKRKDLKRSMECRDRMVRAAERMAELKRNAFTVNKLAWALSRTGYTCQLQKEPSCILQAREYYRLSLRTYDDLLSFGRTGGRLRAKAACETSLYENCRKTSEHGDALKAAEAAVALYEESMEADPKNPPEAELGKAYMQLCAANVVLGQRDGFSGFLNKARYHYARARIPAEETADKIEAYLVCAAFELARDLKDAEALPLLKRYITYHPGIPESRLMPYMRSNYLSALIYTWLFTGEDEYLNASEQAIRNDGEILLEHQDGDLEKTLALMMACNRTPSPLQRGFAEEYLKKEAGGAG